MAAAWAALLVTAAAAAQDPPTPVPVPVPAPAPTPTPPTPRVTPAPAGGADTEAQDAERQRMRRLQAAFLRQIAIYCRWPAAVTRNRREFVVGVVGHDPFGAILEETFGADPIGGMRVSIRRFSADTRDIARSLSVCQVVWVAVHDEQRCKEIVQALAELPVQTVGDHPRFAALGGTVQMFELENRVRFHVARGAAQKAGLEFSSQLLSLSREVPAASQPKPSPEPKPAGEVRDPGKRGDR